MKEFKDELTIESTGESMKEKKEEPFLVTGLCDHVDVPDVAAKPFFGGATAPPLRTLDNALFTSLLSLRRNNEEAINEATPAPSSRRSPSAMAGRGATLLGAAAAALYPLELLHPDATLGRCMDGTR